MRQFALSLLLASTTATAALADYGQRGYAKNDFPLWYLGLQGSIGFMDDTSIELGGNNFGIPDADFDTGYGLGASLGYSPTGTNTSLDDMRFEFEYYFRTNDINDLSGNGNTIAGSGDVKSNNFMLNAFYDFNQIAMFTPYIGVGAGIAQVTLDTPQLTVDDDDSVFAYQLMAGVSWAPEMLLNTELHLGYRLFSTEDPEFTNNAGVGITHDYILHNIDAGVRFKF